MNKKRNYENEYIWNITQFDSRIFDCLKPYEIETLYQLEDYLKSEIEKNPRRIGLLPLFRIKSMGKVSVQKIINSLRKINLEVAKDGNIAHITF